MKIFLDANMLVSVLNKEYPLFTYSSRILSLAENRKFQIYTSVICLAIAFYFSEKKSGTSAAKNKIRLLASKLKITETNQKTVLQTVQNPAINDIEDGLEYYSAVNTGCELIITENREDFYFSRIQVMTSQEFIDSLTERNFKS